MPVPPAEPDRQRAQERRLGTFLRWLIPFAAAFTLLEGLAFLVFRDAALGISSLVSACCVFCFLFAQVQLRQGRLQRAAIILYGVMLAAGLIGSFVFPKLLPMLVVLPLLALVIVLPYVTGRVLYILVAVGWLVILCIATLDEFLPPFSVAPPWFVTLLRISSLATASALLLILLVQFSNRLVEMLTSTERANARLLATQAQLEAQQHDLSKTLAEREEAIALHRAIEERLTALSEAASTLLSLPNQRHVLPAILDLARKVITADAYALWRVHPMSPDWSIAHSLGLSEAYQQKAARALNETRSAPAGVVATPDTEAIPDLMAHRREEYHQEGIRALLVMPLHIRGEMGGTLVFYYREPHLFSEAEVRVATALSHLAAAAITTAELYDEQQQLRTDAETAEQDQAFLAEASRILGSSLDYQTTLASIADLAIMQLSDWCAVYLVDDEGALQEVVVAHQDDARVELARELSRRYLPSPERSPGLMAVIQTGEPIIIPDFDARTEQVAQDGEHLRLLRGIGISSCVLVPMRVGERTIGVLICGRMNPQRRFGPHDLPLLQELAQRAAQAVEHSRLYRTAQNAIRLREQFLSVASHELKTPLTSLIGFADLLQRRTAREGGFSERNQHTLHSILGQAKRLDRLIGSLLDISRIEAGRLQLELAAVELGDLTQRVVAALQPTLELHHVLYQPPAQPLFVVGEALRLEQALHNLIGNAIKYSPGGGTITVQVVERNTTAIVSVSDQGIGVPAEALPHLFQRFYRAPNVDGQYISGMGIGLYIVKEIVTLHGGTVEVTSREGEGSTFTVVLPLSDGHALLEGPAAHQEKRTAFS